MFRTFVSSARFVLLMGIVATGALRGSAIYGINFTTNPGGVAPTSGSFMYDSSAADPFSDFTVIWDGLTFDLTSAANTGEQFFGTGCGTFPSAASVFTFLSGQNVCTGPAAIVWAAEAVNSTSNTSFSFFDTGSQNASEYYAQLRVLRDQHRPKQCRIVQPHPIA